VHLNPKTEGKVICSNPNYRVAVSTLNLVKTEPEPPKKYYSKPRGELMSHLTSATTAYKLHAESEENKIVKKYMKSNISILDLTRSFSAKELPPAAKDEMKRQQRLGEFSHRRFTSALLSKSRIDHVYNKPKNAWIEQLSEPYVEFIRK
jgi:hypothetical protein